MCDVISNRTKRRGMTMIELLIVVSIMLILAVVALPRMRPAMENRQVRESARAMHVFLSRARIAAIQTRRPCGVMFERNDIVPNACTVMRQVEIPPPYGGDDLNTTVTMETASGGFIATLYSGSFRGGLIRIGDLMQVNHQGAWYKIGGPAGGLVDGFFDPNAAAYPSPNPLFLELTLAEGVSEGSSPPWTSTPSEPLPFNIYRQPSVDNVFGSIAPVLQLPRGVVIDLRYSGLNNPGIDPIDATITQSDDFRAASTSDTSPVIVMFSPNGALGGVVYQGTGSRVTEPVSLMVGRWERTLTPLPEDGLANWQDLNNLWVAVTPQTGLITAANPHADGLGEDTNGNGTQDATEPDLNGNGQFDLGVSSTGFLRPVTLSDSRRLVREAQISHGGR